MLAVAAARRASAPACAPRTTASRHPTAAPRRRGAGPSPGRPPAPRRTARTAGRSGPAGRGRAAARRRGGPRAARPGCGDSRSPAAWRPLRWLPGAARRPSSSCPGRGTCQCQAHTGYSSNRAPVRYAAAAATRPAASWSGWPSRRHGATSSVRPPSPTSPVSRSMHASSAAATSPSATSQWWSPIPGPSRSSASRHSTRRSCASRSGGCVGERGWLASPAVSATTSTRVPRVRLAVASSPPAPSVSSSGWAATTTTRSTERPCRSTRTGRHGARETCPSQAAAGVPPASWRKAGGLVTTGGPGRRRGPRERRGPARRGAGGGRAAGRPPGLRGRARPPAARARGRGRPP